MNLQQGLGLPEVLMTLLLTSLMMVLLMHHYLMTTQQYSSSHRTTQNLIELELVTELMRDSARRAGFTPCAGVESLVTADRRGEENPLVAIDLGTDDKPLLRTYRMNDSFAKVLDFVTPTELLVSQQPLFDQKQAVIIADCYHAEVHKISRVSKNSSAQIITLLTPLGFTYRPPVYIGEWVEETFYIKTHAHRVGSLFYEYQRADELTTVVQSMSASLHQYPQGKLLRILLGLEQGNSLELETMLRIH